MKKYRTFKTRLNVAKKNTKIGTMGFKKNTESHVYEVSDARDYNHDIQTGSFQLCTFDYDLPKLPENRSELTPWLKEYQSLLLKSIKENTGADIVILGGINIPIESVYRDPKLDPNDGTPYFPLVHMDASASDYRSPSARKNHIDRFKRVYNLPKELEIEKIDLVGAWHRFDNLNVLPCLFCDPKTISKEDLSSILLFGASEDDDVRFTNPTRGAGGIQDRTLALAPNDSGAVNTVLEMQDDDSDSSMSPAQQQSVIYNVRGWRRAGKETDERNLSYLKFRQENYDQSQFRSGLPIPLHSKNRAEFAAGADMAGFDEDVTNSSAEQVIRLGQEPLLTGEYVDNDARYDDTIPKTVKFGVQKQGLPIPTLKYNPDHRWFWCSDLKPSEYMIWKQSSTHGDFLVNRVPHTSCEHPDYPSMDENGKNLNTKESTRVSCDTRYTLIYLKK